MRVCVSPDYIKKHGVPKKPEDLKAHNCLIYQDLPQQAIWRFVDKNQKEQFIKCQGNFQAGSSIALREAAIAGLGIAMLPGFIITKHLADGRL